MLTCEGYKMFAGSAEVLLKNDRKLRLTGTWLYKPNEKMWYINDCDDFPWGTSFRKDQVENIVEN